MNFTISHNTEEKLKALSGKLKHLARNDNSYANYVDLRIKSENLLFNLSLVISHIVLNLEFVERSHSVFLQILDEYNHKNKTSLTFEDFEKANFIRIVADEIVMPEVIRHFVWQVGYYESEGKPIKVPEDKNDLIRCLQEYHRKCFENARLTISFEKLNELIRTFGSHELSISYFEDAEIVKYDKKGYFVWTGGEFTRHLRNEIASTLWLLVGGEQASLSDFKRYYKLISGIDLWIDNLGRFLNIQNTTRICELVMEFFHSENDLNKSENEFSKIWLDATGYQHVSIDDAIPVLEFNYENTVDFIESVNYHKWRFRDAFDYQRTRSFCHLLLRILVPNESPYPKMHEHALKIIKDTSRPFLLWTLYSDTPKDFPFLIPHFLTDPELIPIAFKLIDKIEINGVFLSGSSNSERSFKKNLELKNDLWIEMFDFVLEQLASNPNRRSEYANIVFPVFVDIAEKIFNRNTNNTNGILHHKSMKERYNEALKKLLTERIIVNNVHPKPEVNPRLLLLFLPDIMGFVMNKILSPRLMHTEFINLTSPSVELAVEFLRFSNTPISQNEISHEQVQNNRDAAEMMVLALRDYIIKYHSTIDVNVKTYDSAGVETRKAKRGLHEFGFETIDWGYLYLNFELQGILEEFENSFTSTLIFEKNENKYNEKNKEQKEKIALHLKSLMLSFIDIKRKSNLYEAEKLPVKITLAKLENWIKELSLKYALDDVPNERIDVFNERFGAMVYDIYHEPLNSLLYNCINHFQPATQRKFVEDLFSESADPDRMLAAINILDSKELQNIISSKCSLELSNKFIEDATTVTELQNAMIEAVNSNEHWRLAEPFLKKVEEHYNRIKHFDEYSQNLIFEVKLLLAFKEKDLAKLSSLPIPKPDYERNTSDQKKESRKRYLIALHNLYHENKYAESIIKFESLHMADATNVDYAFHLFRAKTLKAVSEKVGPPFDAMNSWTQFAENLADDRKKSLLNLEESLELNSIHYHISNDNYTSFESSIAKLTDRFLYDDEIISKVFEYYLKRQMEESALQYLKKAEEYFSKSGREFPDKLKTAVAGGETTDIIKVKASLEKLLGFKPKSVIAAVPSVHNGETDLNTFILIEVVQGLKGLIDKKTSIKSLNEENELNDILQVAIRPRLALFGWSIPDQSRAGKSPTGIDAGELDFVIESGGNKIALIEALVLKGKDKTKTQKHVLKIFDYVGYLQRYYIVIYFKGPLTNFEHTWEEYKTDVLDITFPPSVQLNKTTGFTELSNANDDLRQIKVAKTLHNSDVEIYHIMINLSI